MIASNSTIILPYKVKKPLILYISISIPPLCFMSPAIMAGDFCQVGVQENLLIERVRVSMSYSQYNSSDEAKEKRFKHIKKKDRDKIEVLYNSGVKVKEIAEILGFHRSAIYLELKRGFYEHRNTDWTTKRKYSADKAQRNADYQNTAKGAPIKVGNDYEFIKFVEMKILKEKKSPEAILGEIKRDKIEFKSKITSVRTLYSYII